jgi:hypothetical protein
MNNLVEIIASAISILSKYTLAKKWKYTPLLMACGSLLWILFGVVYQHWGVVALNVVNFSLNIYGQIEWKDNT